eukprot:30443-Pelagococcus_subviridis.AAC.4
MYGAEAACQKSQLRHSVRPRGSTRALALEHPRRRRAVTFRVPVIHQHRDLRVRVRLHEPGAELRGRIGDDVAFPRVVVEPQLFEQHRHLLPVRRPEGVQLQRVLPDWEGSFEPRARGRAVHPAKLPAEVAWGRPSLGNDVFFGEGWLRVVLRRHARRRRARERRRPGVE